MKLEYAAFILIIFQLITASWIYVLDPIMEQGRSALLMSLNFIVTATLLYLYLNRNRIYPSKILELDEEWIAVGLAVTIFIILILVFI